jgi:putative transposase
MSTIVTFRAVLKGLPRKEFDRAVSRHHADKYCKRFTHWQHLVALVYAQLSGASSLRVLELSFNSHAQHHESLQTGAIRRTTLADANERRATTVFDEVAGWLISQVSCRLHREAAALIRLLDSTSITLKGREFDRWTLDDRTRNTQGIKLHLMLDLSTKVPQWYSFSAANVNDVDQAQLVPLIPRVLYVFDKGYCNYNWWQQIDAAGAHFVTRFKSNAALVVQQKRMIPTSEQGVVLCDEIVGFKRKRPSGKRINHYGKPLRRITVQRHDKATPLVLATNDIESPASDIAQRYKERWEIELFFKWLKQHLKIKSFFGRSSNAVRLQLVTALIGYLLVVLYRDAQRMKHTLWECLSMISTSLFAPAVSDATLPLSRRRRSSGSDSQQLGEAR